MNDLDLYFAKECGIVLDEQGFSEGLEDDFGDYIPWSIKNATCRQIIREKFILSTKHNPDGWLCMQMKYTKVGEGSRCLNGRGKSIGTAELNCLREIYEVACNNP